MTEARGLKQGLEHRAALIELSSENELLLIQPVLL